MKTKIGVMGSASGPTIRDPEALKKAFTLGEAIAKRDCICITGACPGLPDRAAEGARSSGGFVMGISPAFSQREHLEIYGSPIKHYDMILFSGLGLMERDIINIRSSDAVVVIGGGIGTLNEFTVAYEEKKPVGVVRGSGGISDHLDEILGFASRHAGPDRLLYDDDPVKLVDRLLDVVARIPPPFRESEIGGEKEESSFAKAECKRRQQRREHDSGQKKRADEEYD
jgi:uncharacterized protein (TIGR00725 family)